MQGIRTFVSNIFYGNNRAFIYIWLSKSEKLVYVGQTNDRFGTWGRSFGHIQPQGTLRMRCEQILGIDVDFIEDLVLVSYLLPQTIEFTGEETSFRLAVEYLVQVGLQEKRKDLTPAFRIISNISISDRTTNRTVKRLAETIVTDFVEGYTAIET